METRTFCGACGGATGVIIAKCNNFWTAAQGNGLVVSTPTVVAGSIPAFCTCLFRLVISRLLVDAADEKTGPVVPYGRIKPLIIVSIYLMGPSKCNYWIAFMYCKFDWHFCSWTAAQCICTSNVPVGKLWMYIYYGSASARATVWTQ